MNDYKNDGRDYGEIIDEGPTNVETEGFFSSPKPDTKDTSSNKQDTKKKQPEKSSTRSSSGRCLCKPLSELKPRRRNKITKKEKMKEKKLKESKGTRKRGRKRKERRLTNPFIIFYLEMYSKHPTTCVAEVAREAGKAWKTMSAKQKEAYINKAKRSQNTKMLTKSKKKGKKSK